MIEIKNQIFHKLNDRNQNDVFENMIFENCIFKNCAISFTNDVTNLTMVRNVTLKSCTANGCAVGPAIFEDILLDGLATNDLLIIWGAVFRRVKLSGDIGKIKINAWAHFVDRSIEKQAPFNNFRETFYQSADWALDISETRFKGFDATGIPARLFRRDPESQAIVTRERLIADDGKRLARAVGNPWLPWINSILSSGFRDGVLVTPLGAPKRTRDHFLQGLQRLRDLGIAEQD